MAPQRTLRLTVSLGALISEIYESHRIALQLCGQAELAGLATCSTVELLLVAAQQHSPRELPAGILAPRRLAAAD